MANQTSQPSGTGFSGGLYMKLSDGTYTPFVDADGNLIGNVEDALASGKIYVGDANGVAAEVSVTGDISLSNTGVTAVNGITTGLFSPTTLTTSGAIAATASYVQLNRATPLIAATIAAPAAGRFLVITQIDAGTAGHTVTLTSGTYNGTNNVATFNAQNETLVLFGISATRFVIVENIGSVAFS